MKRDSNFFFCGHHKPERLYIFIECKYSTFKWAHQSSASLLVMCQTISITIIITIKSSFSCSLFVSEFCSRKKSMFIQMFVAIVFVSVVFRCFLCLRAVNECNIFKFTDIRYIRADDICILWCQFRLFLLWRYWNVKFETILNCWSFGPNRNVHK